MSNSWRLLDTPPMSAAENICVDEAMLTARSKGLIPDTLRFCQYIPSCVLVGFHQSVELEVRQDYCQEKGIEINRRITGGGAIFFDETQLGWELIAQKFDGSRDVLGLYKKICSAAIKGLEKLGIDATFRPVNDIEVRGRKISGTGGTEAGDAFLFQGTLLVDFNVDTMLRALRIPAEKLKDKEIDSIRERVTCLKWELGHVPPLGEIKSAIKEGFEGAFDVEFKEMPMHQFEEEYLGEKLLKFTSEDWIYKIRRPLSDDKMLYSIYKAEGGLIRTSLLLDDRHGVIKYALLTGDFFAYPNRAVLDLEAALKTCRVSKAADKIRRFFLESSPEIPGVDAEDMVNAVEAALRKRDLAKMGLSHKEASKIHPIMDAIDKLDETSVVLLPYCAKMASCKLRYDEDCLECGKCTVGVAYELARRANMEPITVVNFEHLWEVLQEMKDRGVTSYLGCCCEPFFAKHREDFEAAGISGLLVEVDSTSCYELDQEKEAKEGTFKEETKLDLDLLKKLIGEDGLVGKGRVESICGMQMDDDNEKEKLTIKKGKDSRRRLFAREKGLEG